VGFAVTAMAVVQKCPEVIILPCFTAIF